MAEQEKSPQQKTIEQIANAVYTPRINEYDKEVLRSVFAGRVELIVAVRNLFFGYASKEEKKAIAEVFKSDEARRVLHKILLPEMAPDDPFTQSLDLWQTIEIKEESDERIASIVESRRGLIDMLRQSLKLLEDVNGTPVDLDIDSEPVENINYATLMARNIFISHVEKQCASMVYMSASVPETPEEAAARRKKDSNK